MGAIIAYKNRENKIPGPYKLYKGKSEIILQGFLSFS